MKIGRKKVYLNVNIPEDIDLLCAVLMSFMELKALSAELLVIGIVNNYKTILQQKIINPLKST